MRQISGIFVFKREYRKAVKGRERTYFEYFWTSWPPINALDSEADRKAYTEAIRSRDGCGQHGPISRRGRNWQRILRQLAQTKLKRRCYRSAARES